MGQYLFLNMTSEEHKEWGISELIPTRVTESRESKLTMHSEQVLGPHPPKDKEWVFPKESYSKKDKKLLLGSCLYIVIKILFSTHCYSFGGRCYLQSDGGPIGLRAVSPIAKVRIANWLKQMLKHLSNLYIKCQLV